MTDPKPASVSVTDPSAPAPAGIEYYHAPLHEDDWMPLLAMVIRAGHRSHGITFHTPPEGALQAASMRHPAGTVVAPHYHNHVPRGVCRTQEALVIRRGRCCLDLYDYANRLAGRVELAAGDLALLLDGGHGLTMITECEMYELKVGPYMGERDKTRFIPREG